jgi:ATP-dependent DNA helicase DinG
VRKLVLESKGGAFVLFTSYGSLDRTHKAVAKDLGKAGLHVLRQGGDQRTQDIVAAFKERDDCVLFATDTFWQGIDVRGRNLRMVIITRLPFAVPDHPLQQARLERIEEEGGDPFKQYSLPQAVLKLRQGFGRLIRAHDDEGTVAILDPRIVTKTYGRTFLQSLPGAATITDC